MKKILELAVLAIAASVALVSHAERADRNEKARISSINVTREGSTDELVHIFEGDVVITQGTIRITAERAVLKLLPDGRVTELGGNSSKQVTFRQRREGETDFVEASADRGEYDDRTDMIRLYSNVRFKSGGDTVKAEYMQYNSTTEKMEIRNQIPGGATKAATGDSRVVFDIEPRTKADKKSGTGK